MTIFELFGCFTKLPVRIDLVVDVLRDRGYINQVYFCEVDIPTDKLWAQMRAYLPLSVLW
jgi:hypothetical protein